MAINKQAVAILGLTNVPAGTSSATPVAGAAVDVRAFAGGEWGYKITNGSSAPTVGCTIVLQVSPDGTNWFDFYTASGNTAASGGGSGTVTMTRGVMWARLIAYGNVTNAVTVESSLQAVVG